MIKEVFSGIIKKQIAESVLLDLPEWFGLEESRKRYIENVVKYPFIAYYVDEEPIGFYSLRPENEKTLDMYVLGVKKKYHGQGYGTKLQEYVFEYAKDNGYQHVMVLTLSKSHTDVHYAKTRDFYHRLGFIDLYETNKIWGEEYPTQIMIKKI